MKNYLNRLLLSTENYKNFRLPEPDMVLKKVRENCYDLQKATVDYIVNLKPDNIKNYMQVKKDFEECEKKFKFI
jgi:hypothetical protein